MLHDRRRCEAPAPCAAGGTRGPRVRAIPTALLLMTVSALGLLTSGQARANGFTDTFLCYDVKASKGSAKFSPVPNTQIEDAFEDLTFTVSQSRELCNPAEGATDSVDLGSLIHFNRYQITVPKKTPRSAPEDVTVENQFGTIEVDAIIGDKFLVPANKSLAQPPAAPENPGIDHFKCYDVKLHKGSTFTKQQVTLTDQFTGGPKTFDVLGPAHLCPVARKNTEDVLDCCDAFVCYDVKAAKGATKFKRVKNVYTADQFGPLTLDAVDEDEACVRSTITRAGEPGPTCLNCPD